MKKNTKRQYRIRNWKKYNTALVQRGSLTVWIDEAALKNWLHATKTGRPGASRKYTDMALLCGLTLGAVYGLPLRQTQGLVASLLALLDADLPTPHYTIFCRRRKQLTVTLPRQAPEGPIQTHNRTPRAPLLLSQIGAVRPPQRRCIPGAFPPRAAHRPNRGPRPFAADLPLGDPPNAFIR